MSANKWFKFYGGEYLSDPKMDAFDGNEKSVWLTILSLASQTDDGWVRYTSEEKLLEKASVRPEHRSLYTGLLMRFVKFSMLELCNGSVTEGFRPLNWEKRQYSEAYSRIKKYRNKKSNENVTEKSTTQENRIEENRIDKNRTDVDVAVKKESKKTKSQRLNSGYSEEFEKFWELYPNKVAKGKAYEVFQLLEDNIQLQCIGAIDLQVKANHFWYEWVDNGKGGDSPPHPTTWLNQKRWEDVIVKKERKGRIQAPTQVPQKSYE